MAPFPEAEDMTVKRLYVALKRNDMQLLQMGAHKLHEKFHTGYQFELLDDLKQILSYVEEQDIPSDIKDLLLRTIKDILNGTKPEAYENPAPVQEVSNYTQGEEIPFEENAENENLYKPQTEEIKDESFNQDETVINEQNTSSEEPVIFTPQENCAQENSDMQESQNCEETALQGTLPLNGENFQNEENFTAQNQESSQNEEMTRTESTPQNYEQNQEQFEANTENENEAQNQIRILEEQEITLKDVAVFYDDKAGFVDFMKNKAYRCELDRIALGEDISPLNNAGANKSIVDIQTDEIGEILKMLNTIKGSVYFVTTSKSENIIKAFIENNVNFEIPLVTTESAKTKLIPLLGLSNIFVCPKCGKKEYFGGIHNKVLSLQCKNCSSAMYPNLYEALNLDTNASVYYWINAINSMAHADTWILINPPLENNRALIVEFIKTSFEVSKPKKVYILSKETTKKEYYKQMFKEIDESCIINSDYIMPDNLCEDFINNEMSSIKVNV